MLKLYYTSACHLCEEAEGLVIACFAARGIAPDSLMRVEIADDVNLLERYGILIPVLKDEASGRKLKWPFGLDEINLLLQPIPSPISCNTTYFGTEPPI